MHWCALEGRAAQRTPVYLSPTAAACVDGGYGLPAEIRADPRHGVAVPRGPRRVSKGTQHRTTNVCPRHGVVRKECLSANCILCLAMK